MIKYKPLPLERALESAENDKARLEIMLSYRRQLVECQGFQVVVKAFRDLELDTVNRLQTSQGHIERLAGRLDALNFLRAAVLEDGPWENAATEEGLPEDFE